MHSHDLSFACAKSAVETAIYRNLFETKTYKDGMIWQRTSLAWLIELILTFKLKKGMQKYSNDS